MKYGMFWLSLAAACGSTEGPDGGVPSSPDANVFDSTVDTRDAEMIAADHQDASNDDGGIPTEEADAGLGDPFEALRALPETCSADGWCWRWPKPHGNDYSRVFSTAPDNIWLIGQHGIVMQWNGRSWRFHQPRVLPGEVQQQFPMSIGGNAPDNMWLIFGTTLQQWDGERWTIRDQLPLTGNPLFNNLWAAPDGQVFATVSDGSLRWWHDGVLDRLNTGCACFLGNIWGLAADDFYITTLGAGLLHYDGREFRSVYRGAKIVASYTGVKDDLWVSGEDGALVHWDGAAWTEYQTGLRQTRTLSAVHGGRTASDDVWFWTTDALLHWDGRAISTVPLDITDTPGFHSVALIDGRWWFVGRDGSILTKVGPDTLMPVLDLAPTEGFLSWGTAADNLYFVSGGQIDRYDGTHFTSTRISINAVTGICEDGVDYLFGFGQERLSPDLTQWALNAFYFDGNLWSKTRLVTTDFANRRSGGPLVVRGPAEAIAITAYGEAHHFLDGVWNTFAIDVVAPEFTGSWSPDADNLWLSGKHGEVWRWNIAAPTSLVRDLSFPASVTEELGPIHGAGDAVWIACAQRSSVFQSSGAGWTELSAYTTGSPGGGLWVIDANNAVLSSSGQSLAARWNGTAWTREDTNSGVATPGLYMPFGGPMFMGSRGKLLEYRP